MFTPKDHLKVQEIEDAISAITFYLAACEDDYREDPEENPDFVRLAELYYKLTDADFLGQRAHLTHFGKFVKDGPPIDQS